MLGEGRRAATLQPRGEKLKKEEVEEEKHRRENNESVAARRGSIYV